MRQQIEVCQTKFRPGKPDVPHCLAFLCSTVKSIIFGTVLAQNYPASRNLAFMFAAPQYAIQLRCMHYVFDVYDIKVTVYIAQVLIWSGIDYILQRTVKLSLWDSQQAAIAP